MSGVERIATVTRAVNLPGDAHHVAEADDIERAETLSTGVDVENDGNSFVSARKRRYKIFLNILQKVNMCFLVLFIAYFVWTISTNHGHTGAEGTSWNHSGLTNTSREADEYFNFSGLGDSFIPKISSTEDNHTDPPNYRRFVTPTHRKQTKKRRKKGRNRKRKMRIKNRNRSFSNINDYMNLTGEPRKNRDAKSTCSDCKIRKRKGRKRFNGKISPHIFRKILEKVADDTLSGARAGEGTITSILEEDGYVNKEKERRKQKPSDWSEWSYDHHWANVAGSDTVISDNVGYDIEDNFSDGYLTPWSRWSSCSASCGAGQQERTRKCGSACTEVESMVCLKPKCEDGSMDESSNTITEFYKWEKEGFVPPLKLPEQEDLDHNTDVCSNWVKCNKNFAQDYIRNASLPGCPCFFPLVRVNTKNIYDVNNDADIKWVDSSSHSDLVYKPGAKACMRSTLVKGTSTLAVQQCCYDNTHMLVTRGSAAGTPLLISPEISEELHYKVDLLPWIICKGDWSRYHEVLAPNNQLQCHTNPDDGTFEWQKNQTGNY